MGFLNPFVMIDRALAMVLDRLQSLLALVARGYVSWQFFKSGLLKIQSWDTTLFLFQDEYRVPLLSPHIAAVVGTTGELLFPVLVVAGLCSRVGALGLFAVNAMAVISYRHVLLSDGYEAALAQHVLWGAIATYLAIHGAGKFAFDEWLARHRRSTLVSN